MNESEEELRQRLVAARQEHRSLDTLIKALLDGPAGNMLETARLKKRKLRLKDEITALSNLLIPDIIA